MKKIVICIAVIVAALMVKTVFAVEVPSVNFTIKNNLAEPINYSTIEKINVTAPATGTIDPGVEQQFDITVTAWPIFAFFYNLSTDQKGTLGDVMVVQVIMAGLQCNQPYAYFNKEKVNKALTTNISSGFSCSVTSGGGAINITLTLSYLKPPKAQLTINNLDNGSDTETLSLLSADPGASSEYYSQTAKPAASIAVKGNSQSIYTPAPQTGKVLSYDQDATLEYGYQDNDGKSSCVISYHVVPLGSSNKQATCQVSVQAMNENPNRKISCDFKTGASDASNNLCSASVDIGFGDEKAQTTKATMSNTTSDMPSSQDASISLQSYSPQPNQSTKNYYQPTAGPSAYSKLDANATASYNYIQKNLTDAKMRYAYTANNKLYCDYTYGREGDSCTAQANTSEYIGTVRSLTCSATAIPQSDGTCKADMSMKFGDYREREIGVTITNKVIDVVNQPVALTRTALTPSSSAYSQEPPTEIKASATNGFVYSLVDPGEGSVTYTYQQGNNTSSCKISYNWTFSPFSQNLGCSVTTEVVHVGQPGILLACSASPVELAGQACSASVNIETGQKLPPLSYQVTVHNYSALDASLANANPDPTSSDYSSAPAITIARNASNTFSLDVSKNEPTPSNPAYVNYQYKDINYACKFSYSWDPSKLCEYNVEWVQTVDDQGLQAPLASGLMCSGCPSVQKYDPNTRTCYVGFAISLSRNCEVN